MCIFEIKTHGISNAGKGKSEKKVNETTSRSFRRKYMS